MKRSLAVIIVAILLFGYSAVATRREALRLYRDVLRLCKKFNFRNEKGERWSDVLKKSARQEFEQGRWETDPIIITKLIIGGRDALQQIEEKFAKKQLEIMGIVDKDGSFVSEPHKQPK